MKFSTLLLRLLLVLAAALVVLPLLMRYGIMGIPTLLYFKDGKEVDRQVGVTGYPTLANKLEKLLN